MNMIKSKIKLLLILTFLSLIHFFEIQASDLPAVWLTYQQDPTTTITVHWLSFDDEKSSQLFYSKKEDIHWQTITGTTEILHQKMSLQLHEAELTNLEADSEYVFYFERPELEKNYYFKTLPKMLKAPLTFVVGGDIFRDTIEDVAEMNKIAADISPSFALLGGDLAYSASRTAYGEDDLLRWLQFLRCWSKTMITKEGMMIPIIATLGNHDVNGGYEQTPKEAYYYYRFFVSPGNIGYRVVDCGKWLSIFALDTNHTNPITGHQEAWLAKNLIAHRNTKHKIAFYHVPAYPSVRALEREPSITIRRTWVPLFEWGQLDFAFEHHDHAYKRTFPLLKGKVNPRGVVYMGDGCWGIKDARTPSRPGKRWFLANSAAKQHIMAVTVTENEIQVDAIDSAGSIFDSISRK